MPEGTMRTVIVDDSDTMRLLLRRILGRDARFKVVAEAEDGRQAIDAAREHQPDLVLLDIRMPVMDGFEALPGIRRAAPRARVAVVTGMTSNETEARARELGAAAFIDKDLPPARFKAALLALAEPWTVQS